MDENVIKIVSAIAIAAVSAWITVQLSMKKFRSERWWEKKVEAYERVIEAFHNAKKFASENMIAEEQGREIEESRDAELRAIASAARDEILKASDIGSFILSKKSLSILAKYEAESENASKEPSWYQYLEATWSMNNSYMRKFIEEAQRDLKS